MAVLTITPANISRGDIGVRQGREVRAGEAIQHIAPCYRGEDGKFYEGNAGDWATAQIEGLAFEDAAADEDYFYLITEGRFQPGATLTANTMYVLSATDGKIMPASDLATGNYIVQLGWSISTTDLVLDIKFTGLVAA